MCAFKQSNWLGPTALGLLILFAGRAASAQSLPTRRHDPGVASSPTLTASVAGAVTTTQTPQRRADPLWNGAIIGVGVAIATGLFLCTRTEPWENCRDDVGPILKIGALGAGIGVAVDALIRRRQHAANSSEAPVVHLTTRLSRTAGGVHLSLVF